MASGPHRLGPLVAALNAAARGVEAGLAGLAGAGREAPTARLGAWRGLNHDRGWPTPPKRPQGGRVSARLPKIPVSSLTPDQRALYDAIAGGPRAAGPQAFALVDSEGGLEGPFNAMLLSPRLGSALQALGSAVRYQSALSSRALELAILAVAYTWDSGFERYAHEAAGRSAGLTWDEIDAVRQGRFDGLADPHERAVAATAHALASQGDLDDAEYAKAREALGEALLFELSTLVGYYATLALQLRVFRVTSPDQRQPAGGAAEP